MRIDHIWIIRQDLAEQYNYYGLKLVHNFTSAIQTIAL